VDNVDGISLLLTLLLPSSFIFSDGDFDDGEGDNDGSTEFNELLKDSPSLSTALFKVVVGGGSEDEDCTMVSKFSSLLSTTTLDNVVVGGGIVVASSSPLLVVVVVVLLQPVMPAKQLCVISEHSNRDPPGHGSHTLLALDAETPHYLFF